MSGKLVGFYYFISMKAKKIFVKPEIKIHKLETDLEFLAGSQGGSTDPWEQEESTVPSSRGVKTNLWELEGSTGPWEQE